LALRVQSSSMAPYPLRGDNAREQFYQDCAAACDELGIAPLPYPEFLALLGTLAEWASAPRTRHRGKVE
jgi:hypothetical protein